MAGTQIIGVRRRHDYKFRINRAAYPRSKQLETQIGRLYLAITEHPNGKLIGLAKEIGLSGPTITQRFNNAFDKDIPKTWVSKGKDEKIRNYVEQLLNTSFDWILTGEGEQYFDERERKRIYWAEVNKIKMEHSKAVQEFTTVVESCTLNLNIMKKQLEKLEEENEMLKKQNEFLLRLTNHP